MKYWYWENLLSQKDIVYLNNYINKNYDHYEDTIKVHTIKKQVNF